MRRGGRPFVVVVLLGLVAIAAGLALDVFTDLGLGPWHGGVVLVVAVTIIVAGQAFARRRG